MKTVDNPRRSAVYLRQDLHKALEAQAAETSSTISELLDMAVEAVLKEDMEDLAIYRERSGEPTIPFDEMLKRLNLDQDVFN